MPNIQKAKTPFCNNQKVTKKIAGYHSRKKFKKNRRTIMSHNNVELQALIDKISSSPEAFPNEVLYGRILYILSQSLIPLPVAPKQCAKKYPKWYKDEKSNTFKIALDKFGNPKTKFTGKNPSYLDVFGDAHILNHKDFQNRFPSFGELKTWFCNPNTGIGTRGNHEISWIDIDVKNLENPEEFIAEFIQANKLDNTWIERTPSGGCHIAVKLGKKPDFTKFSVGELKDIGEIIDDELFIVTAPTTGYTTQNLATPMYFESLADLVQPSRTEKKAKSEKSNNILNSVQNLNNFNFFENAHLPQISHQKVFSQKVRNILVGNIDEENDRSKAITKAYNEFYGWQNFLAIQEVGLDVTEADFDSVLSDAFGVDLARLERIKKTIERFTCHPSIYYAKGEDSVWQKIKYADFEIFKTKCPQEIQEGLKKALEKDEENNFIYKVDSKVFKSPKPLSVASLKCSLSQSQLNNPTVVDEAEFSYGDKDYYGNIVMIKSPMGTGKTQASLAHIKKLHDRDSLGIFWISARNNLLHQVIADAKEHEIQILHLNESDGNETLFDSALNHALCAESICKIDGFYVGRDVYIDEIVTVVDQLLGGGTVSGSKQSKVLRTFQNVIRHARTIYCLDANITQREIDFLKNLCPERELLILENKHPGRKASFKIFDCVSLDDVTLEKKRNKRDRTELIAQLKLPGKTSFIVSDSKKECDRIEKLLMDAGKVGFNLNSSTSHELSSDWETRYKNARKLDSDIWSKEFLENPNEFVEKYKPDFFIGSPTIENGVSYTGTYFNQKAGIFVGNLSTNGILQMLFRNRDNTVETLLYCPIESTIQKDWAKIPEVIKVMMEQLQDSKKYYHSNFLEVYQAACARCCELEPFWEYKREIDKAKRFEHENLRACLIYRLEELGHNVSIFEVATDTEIRKEIKEAGELLDKVKAEKIFQAETFESKEDCEKAKKKPGHQTEYRVAKFKLLEKLPEIESSPNWNEDFVLQNYVKNQEVIYHSANLYNFQNEESFTKRTEMTDFKKLNAEYVSQSNILDDRFLTLKCLRDIGFREFLEKMEGGMEISKNSDDVIQIIKKASSKKIQALDLKLFRFTKKLDGSENINIIKKFLKWLGYDLHLLKRERTDKGTQRFYVLDIFVPNPKPELQRRISDRKVIYECIERRFKNQLAEYEKPSWGFNEAEENVSIGLDSKDFEIEVAVSDGMTETVTIKHNEIVSVANGLKCLIKGTKINQEATEIRLKKILQAYEQDKKVRDLIANWDCTIPELIAEYA